MVLWNIAGADAIDLYPLLRNYDVWGETVGINWNTIACEWQDYLYSSGLFIGLNSSSMGCNARALGLNVWVEVLLTSLRHRRR